MKKQNGSLIYSYFYLDVQLKSGVNYVFISFQLARFSLFFQGNTYQITHDVSPIAEKLVTAFPSRRAHAGNISHIRSLTVNNSCLELISCVFEKQNTVQNTMYVLSSVFLVVIALG